jgi:exopolysaccharide production protein ExoY
LRLSMIPGITGLWQVSGRNEIPYDQRVIFDRTYYYTRSTMTDLALLLRTIPAVLSRRGAF